jgi:Flp pilus assembly protein TadG
VEFALVLPVVLLILLGALQFALVVHARNVVTTAAQEGARIGAADGRTPAEGAARAEEVLASGLSRSEDTFTVTAQDAGEAVVIRAVGRYRLIIPWVTGRTIPIEATAEVRREGFRRGP